jgi:hypothetical protein
MDVLNMSKSKNFIIDLEVYPFDIMVSINETDSQLFKKLDTILAPKNRPTSYKILKMSGNGRTVMFHDLGVTVIRLKNYPDNPVTYGVLQHEIFHAVEFIMDKIGMRLSPETGEAYAYLIAFVTQKIYEKI